jgi:hypothetical protein
MMLTISASVGDDLQSAAMRKRRPTRTSGVDLTPLSALVAIVGLALAAGCSGTHDLYTVPTERLKDLKCELTLVAGRIVYGS